MEPIKRRQHAQQTQTCLLAKDDLIWQNLEEESDSWCESLSTSETYREVGNFLFKYKKHVKPEHTHPVARGGYNIVYHLEFQDGTLLIMRVPIKSTAPTDHADRRSY